MGESLSTRENPHRKANIQSPGLNIQPSCCEVTALTTAPALPHCVSQNVSCILFLSIATLSLGKISYYLLIGRPTKLSLYISLSLTVWEIWLCLIFWFWCHICLKSAGEKKNRKTQSTCKFLTSYVATSWQSSLIPKKWKNSDVFYFMSC